VTEVSAAFLVRAMFNPKGFSGSEEREN